MFENEKEVMERIIIGEQIEIDRLEKEKRKLEKENEQLKAQIETKRKKLFDILTEYEIGNYDTNTHQFYKDVYNIHNELMELAE